MSEDDRRQLMVVEADTQESLTLIPLSSRPELSDLCADLLNEEWPRSKALRQRSIQNSLNAYPPMTLVLLRYADELIGHARVCCLPLESIGACWVESVVVRRALRRTGIGRKLMVMLEDYVRQLGFHKVYLSTRDKESFYRKCGYTACAPVVYAGHSKLLERAAQLIHSQSKQESESPQPLKSVDWERVTVQDVLKPIQPLPPPPPHSAANVPSIRSVSRILPESVTFMCKSLCG